MATLPRISDDLLATGEYPVIVADCNLVDSQYGEQIAFTLQLVDDPTRELRAWANARFGARSKLFKWATALFGKPIPDTYTQLNTEHLVGRRALAVVTVRQKDDGSEYNRVEGLRALPVAVAPADAPADAPATAAPLFPPHNDATEDDIPW